MNAFRSQQGKMAFGHVLWYGLCLLIAVGLLAGCASQQPPAERIGTPGPTAGATSTGGDAEGSSAGLGTTSPPAEVTGLPSPTPRSRPITVGWPVELPERYTRPLLQALLSLEGTGEEPALVVVDRPSPAQTQVVLRPRREASLRLAERFYAAVVPFATVQDTVAEETLRARWRGEEPGTLVAPREELVELTALWGGPPAATVVVTDTAAVLDALSAVEDGVGILPFDGLDPRYKVLHVETGPAEARQTLNVLDNHLDVEAYPLAVALTVEGPGAETVATRLLEALDGPLTNRDPSRLTVLIMTGVTAMSRVTALRMEQKGYLYPALVISDTLRAADITHISNEVPFLDDCQVNAAENNLILCSHTNYWAALEALGTDIVGLSGNHVNDFGREGAVRSITWYREHGIPIYGSGLNVEEACAPLLYEHNGNRFAFFAALAFYPESAWATEDQPGACYYYHNKERILAAIQELRPQVDIISVELQYLETYEPFPTAQQVVEFRELREAGADIVTGVQSHVPQAMEPYGPEPGRNPSMIVYGLGNLFFDQMWSWETRTELMARHVIYQGRLISTEILTAVLEDYAQPRWATPEERAEILQRIFAAAPRR